MAAVKYGVKTVSGDGGGESFAFVVTNVALKSFVGITVWLGRVIPISPGAFAIPLSARSANVGPLGPSSCGCHWVGFIENVINRVHVNLILVLFGAHSGDLFVKDTPGGMLSFLGFDFELAFISENFTVFSC